MKRRDTNLLTLLSDILRGKHGGVGGGFVTVGFDFHTASDAYECFAAGEVCDVYKCVVEGGEDVAYGEDIFVFLDFVASDSAGVDSWFGSVEGGDEGVMSDEWGRV